MNNLKYYINVLDDNELEALEKIEYLDADIIKFTFDFEIEDGYYQIINLEYSDYNDFTIRAETVYANDEPINELTNKGFMFITKVLQELKGEYIYKTPDTLEF